MYLRICCNKKTMHIHTLWNCLLFDHLLLTSSCLLCSELFSTLFGILTGRCFHCWDQGQRHKRIAKNVVCNVFAISSTLLTQVSSLHPGGGSDPPERNDASDTESEWCESVFLNSINITAEMNVKIVLWIFISSIWLICNTYVKVRYQLVFIIFQSHQVEMPF